jgi:hypothetical protein
LRQRNRILSELFIDGSAGIDDGPRQGRSSRNQGKSLPMRMKWLLAAAVIAGLAGTGVALSQDQSQKDQSQPAATTTEKVKAISKKEWDKMKVQWAKQKENGRTATNSRKIKSSPAARAGPSSRAA